MWVRKSITIKVLLSLFVDIQYFGSRDRKELKINRIDKICMENEISLNAAELGMTSVLVQLIKGKDYKIRGQNISA